MFFIRYMTSRRVRPAESNIQVLKSIACLFICMRVRELSDTIENRLIFSGHEYLSETQSDHHVEILFPRYHQEKIR